MRLYVHVCCAVNISHTPSALIETRSAAAEGFAVTGLISFSDSMRDLEGRDTQHSEHAGTTQLARTPQQGSLHHRNPYRLESGASEIDFEDGAVWVDEDFESEEFGALRELDGLDDNQALSELSICIK